MNPEQELEEFPEIPPEKYKIVSKIDQGAFSTVFLAYTPDMQRRAIKRIRLTSKPKLLLKEIQFLRQLKGKSCICQLKEVLFGEQTLETSIVTSYNDATEFKQLIKRATPDLIQSYMQQLLIALSHLETTNGGILHRDIKAGNYLFNEKTRRGILIDFGLAQTLKEAQLFSGANQAAFIPHTTAKFINIFQVSSEEPPKQPHAGTHGYRAPETLFPLFKQSEKIDIWSAGIILLQILLCKTGIFRSANGTDVYEILAIRNLLGTDRFIQAMGQLGVDFAITAGVTMPQAITIEELCSWNNPDLFVTLKPSIFDLARQLLEFDHKRRPTARQVLKHKFFSEVEETQRYELGAYQESVLIQQGAPEDANYWIQQQRIQDICTNILKISAIQKEKFLDYYLNKKPASLEYDKEIKNFIFKAEKAENLDEPVIYEYGYKISRVCTIPSYQDFIQTAYCKIDYFTTERHPSALVDSQLSEKSINEANEQNERLQRVRRHSAIRRRMDPYIEAIKALNFELMKKEELIREKAEEYRKIVISSIKTNVVNSFQQIPQSPTAKVQKDVDLGEICSVFGNFKCQNRFLEYLLGQEVEKQEVTENELERQKINENIINMASICYKDDIYNDVELIDQQIYNNAVEFLKDPQNNDYPTDNLSDSISLSENYFDPSILNEPETFEEQLLANEKMIQQYKLKRRQVHTAEHQIFSYEVKQLQYVFTRYEQEQNEKLKQIPAIIKEKPESVAQKIFKQFDSILQNKTIQDNFSLEYQLARNYQKQKSIFYLKTLINSPLGLYYSNITNLYKTQQFSPSELYANMKYASDANKERVKRVLIRLADLCTFYCQTQLFRKDLSVINTCLNGAIPGVPAARREHRDRPEERARGVAAMPYAELQQRYPATAAYLEDFTHSVLQNLLAQDGAIDEAVDELETAISAIEARIMEALVEEMSVKFPQNQLYKDVRAAMRVYGAAFTLQVVRGSHLWIESERQECLKSFGRQKYLKTFEK